MAAYSTVATVKEYLGIPTASTTDDAAITAALEAAEERIDQHCGRTFVVPAAVSTRTTRPWSSKVVTLPAGLAQLADLVVKTDTAGDGVFDTTVTAAEYYVDGDTAPYGTLVRVTGTWPTPSTGRPSVEVEGWYGYAMTVPYSVTQAATMQAARLHQRRSSPLGFQTGTSPEMGAVRVSRVDPDVASLLVGYRVPAVA